MNRCIPRPLVFCLLLTLLVLSLFAAGPAPTASTAPSTSTDEVVSSPDEVVNPQPPLDVAVEPPVSPRPASSPAATRPDASTRAAVQKNYGKASLSFQANRGQADPEVRFLSQGKGYGIFLTDKEVILTLVSTPSQSKQPAKAAADWMRKQDGSESPVERPANVEVIRMSLEGSNQHPRIEGQEAQSSKTNYIIGKDPKGWHTGVPSYSRVKYESVYPGIDAVYYGKQRQIEYDFVVAPGASPQVITLSFAGAREVVIADNGDLVLRAHGGEIRQHKPVLYQQVGETRRPVEGRYEMRGANKVGFAVGAYDHSLPLVIDPVLSYATFLGSPSWDFGTDIAVDCAGNAYVSGWAYWNIPTHIDTTQGTFLPADSFENWFASDIFVTKLDPEGRIVYSTFIGGNGQDMAEAVTTDAEGNVYVAGYTHSTDFPQPGGRLISHASAGDALVFALGPDGDSVKYTAVIGGRWRDHAYGVAVDRLGYIYLTGVTESYTPAPYPFPTTTNALQRENTGNNLSRDAFVLKLHQNPNETYISNFVYSTRLGGDGDDVGRAIAVDEFGNAYVTGHTSSPNFPGASAGGYVRDTFVTKLNEYGSAVRYSTRFGSGEVSSGADVVLDASRNAYVTGYIGNYQGGTAYVKKFNPDGGQIFSATIDGGHPASGGKGIALDFKGNIHVVGTSSVPDADPEVSDVFVVGLSEENGLLYTQSLASSGPDQGGGIAVDGTGNVVVAGTAGAYDFPVTENAAQPYFGEGCCDGLDAFVVRLEQNLRLPMIFVPAIAGSRLVDRDINILPELWPGVGRPKSRLTLHPDEHHDRIVATDVIRNIGGLIPYYDGLLQTLVTSGGFTEYQVNGDPERRTPGGCDLSQRGNNPDLFVFAYDWRLDNAANARLLKDYVRCVQKLHGDNVKVNILAHSMGGLLARRYILDNPDDHRVNKLITIGSSWLGAPKGIHVLETGQYPGLNAIITPRTLRRLAEFFPGAHQLLPASAYYDIGGRPMREKGDFNNNNISNETYIPSQWLALLNALHPHPQSRPGTTAREFHDRLGQDDWREDQTCVQYHHIVGEKHGLDTIGQVIASRKPARLRSGRFILRNEYKLAMVKGDGTVPTFSASRVNGDINMNAPKGRTHRWYVFAQTPRWDDEVEHTGLTRSPTVHEVVLHLLGIGPKPPGFDNDFEGTQGAVQAMRQSTSAKSAQAPASASQLQVSDGLLRGLDTDHAEVPDRQPSYYLTVKGTDFVSVTDSQGNINTELDETFAKTVPGTNYHLLGDNGVLVTAPSDDTYTFTFRPTEESITIELLKGVGNQSPIEAIRYVDLLPTPGGVFRIVTSPAGVNGLSYDANNDGVFETNITPTASVSGPAASDVDAPDVSISGQRQGPSATVSVIATDAGSGVKDLYYSLDGSDFRPYTGPLVVDVSLTGVVYAFADDQVGNRSDVVSFDLNAPPPDRIAFVSYRDGQQQIYSMNAEGLGLKRLSDGSGSDFAPAWSPDGKRLAFFSHRDGYPRIYLMDEDGGDLTPLTGEAYDLASEQAPVWSHDGARLAFVRYVEGVRQVFVADTVTGAQTQLTSGAEDAESLAWSPDGARIAFTLRGEWSEASFGYARDVHVVNADGTGLTRLSNGLSASELAWSADGSRLAFVALSQYLWQYERNGADIYVVNADGTDLRPLTQNSLSSNPAWSPDGTKLAFSGSLPGHRNTEIYVMDVTGGGLTRVTNDDPGEYYGSDHQPSWSPDGARLVYVKYDGNWRDIYVVNADGTGAARLTSNQSSNDSPQWRKITAATPPPADAAPPSTALTPSQPANADGWNNSDVTLTLVASDDPGGSGVKEIVFSSEGAQAAPEQVVSGASLNVTITVEGQTTVRFFARDNAGNAEAVQSLTVRLDKTAPNPPSADVTPAANSAGWNSSDVTVTFTHGGDTGADPSGVKSCTDPVSVTAETISTFVGGNCTDAAGNVSADTSVAVKLDKTAPLIAVASPAETVYTIGQSAQADFNCSDSGSGVVTCAGTAADGAALNTASIGAQTFAVNATDAAGNSATKTVSYTVGYGVRPLHDQSKVHKSGSTVHVQVEIINAAGANLSSPGIAVTAFSVARVSSDAGGPVEEYNDGEPDANFTYQSGSYRFKLKTTGYAAGTYRVYFHVAGDPTVHWAEFRIRQ